MSANAEATIIPSDEKLVRMMGLLWMNLIQTEWLVTTFHMRMLWFQDLDTITVPSGVKAAALTRSS
jgi:hypothetical protein